MKLIANVINAYLHDNKLVYISNHPLVVLDTEEWQKSANSDEYGIKKVEV